jgi:hypothetical protein
MLLFQKIFECDYSSDKPPEITNPNRTISAATTVKYDCALRTTLWSRFKLVWEIGSE